MTAHTGAKGAIHMGQAQSGHISATICKSPRHMHRQFQQAGPQQDLQSMCTAHLHSLQHDIYEASAPA